MPTTAAAVELQSHHHHCHCNSLGGAHIISSLLSLGRGIVPGSSGLVMEGRRDGGKGRDRSVEQATSASAIEVDNA